MAVITTILVLGIRESARTNATLVAVKLAVVVFVILAGWGYVNPANWTSIPVAQRRFPQEKEVIPDVGQEIPCDPQGACPQERLPSLRKKSLPPTASIASSATCEQVEKAGGDVAKAREELAVLSAGVAPHLPQTEADRQAVAEILPNVRQNAGGSRGQVVGHPRLAGAEPLAAAHRRRHAQPFHALRTVGHHAGRGDRVLRLHRLRFHLHARGRGPAARNATCPSGSSSRCGFARCCTSWWRRW